MSRSEIERFMTDVQRDPSLAKQFKPVEKDVNKAVSFANERGYDFSASEAVDSAAPQGELSDGSLEKVAGGWSIGCDKNTINPTIKCK